jgi:hypothetical protein
MSAKRLVGVALLFVNIGVFLAFTSHSPVAAGGTCDEQSEFCFCMKGHYPGEGWCDDSINPVEEDCKGGGDAVCQGQT